MLDHKSFFPVSWLNRAELNSLRERGEWYEFLSRSYGVHMFHTSTQAEHTNIYTDPDLVTRA